jgi:hypothetical protein
LSDIEYELLFEENFWLVGPPNAIVPISEGISQANLNPVSQSLLTQPWIAYSEGLPIAPALARGVLQNNRPSTQTNYSRFKSN